MPFVRAVKGRKPLRLVVGGPPGSGKTYTALLFAQWLAKRSGLKIAAVDTEHGRLSLYADQFEFDVDEIDPPFDPQILIDRIHDAEKAGYGVMIIDSSTHFYAGEGGLLEMVNDWAKRSFGGNTYYAWQKGTPLQNRLIDAILRSPMHIIVTSRSKNEYLEQDKGNGKKTYEKTGLALVQRDGIEYEFDFAMRMDANNVALIEKGMGKVPPGTTFEKPGEKAITAIMEAIEKDSVVVERPVTMEEAKAQMIARIKELGGKDNPKVVEAIKLAEGSEGSKAITGNPNNLKTLMGINEVIKLLRNLKQDMELGE